MTEWVISLTLWVSSAFSDLFPSFLHWDYFSSSLPVLLSASLFNVGTFTTLYNVLLYKQLDALMGINTHTPLPHKSMQHPCREHSPSTTTLSYLDPQGGNFQHYCLLHSQNLPCFIDPCSHKEMKGGLLQQVTHVLAWFDHNVERAGWGETQERKKASEAIWSLNAPLIMGSANYMSALEKRWFLS